MSERRTIPAATVAALWTLSAGNCYAPGCPFPVIHETRPGIYRKNAQISHVYGVAPGAPRYRSDLAPDERDSFSNLLLLCTAHHSDVDDPRTGARDFPPGLLLRWKSVHEAGDGKALSLLGKVDGDQLERILEQVFQPPMERLESLAEKLEQTGHLTADNLRELQRIVRVFQGTEGPDRQTVATFAGAVDALGSMNLSRTVDRLSEAAEIIALSAGRPREY